MELNTFKILRLFSSPAAIAKGADLLPGHKIKFLTPIFVKRSKSCKLLKKFWHSIDERSAGFHSLGISTGSGDVSIVVTTSGTAVGNLLPAAIEADKSCLSLIHI